MVQSRIRAAVVELRLQEGVSERPLRGYRAEDPLLDLLLRLLGVGDDPAETQLRDPLDVAAEKAAWIATREVAHETSDAEASQEVLPNYVIAAPDAKVEEHVVIGWQPTEDDLEDFAKELEAVVNDPPPPLGPPGQGPASMVSFDAADAVERAQEDARQQALGRYSGPRYPSLAGQAEGEASDEVELSEPLSAGTPEVLPTPPEGENPALPDYILEAAPSVEPAVAQPRRPSATALKPTPTSASRPQRVEPVSQGPDAQYAAPSQPTLRGLDSGVGTLALIGAALLVLVLFLGSAYMGGQRLQSGQKRADVTRAKLYSAIALDENLVRDMVELGADGSLLQQRYQQYAVAKEPQKARRALALSRALEQEIQGTRAGSVRARQLEQMVQHIGSARITYTHAVEEWAFATRGLLGGLALTLGFGQPPASDAILPLE